MKFETKLKFYGGEFASFYSTISRATDYYKALANSGSDLSKNAMNIIYWRIMIGIKQRLESIAVRKQNEISTHISLKLNDVETACMLNAILPPDNNSYNLAVIAQVRNHIYKSAHQHIFNLYPAATLLAPIIDINQNEASGKVYTIEDAEHAIANLKLFDYEYSITSYHNTPEDPRKLIQYQNLTEALEDVSRIEPIIIQASDLPPMVVNPNK